jgi:hypothetical protein
VAADTLQLASGQRADIVSVTRERLEVPVDVYNVEVADFHTYFVASAGVWVHNCGGEVQGAVETAVHGNSAASTRISSLYRRYDNMGEYLKTGISQNPATRYTQTYMLDKRMDIISEGSRRGMLDLERSIVEVDPGSINLESWAGRYSGGY